MGYDFDEGAGVGFWGSLGNLLRFGTTDLNQIANMRKNDAILKSVGLDMGEEVTGSTNSLEDKLKLLDVQQQNVEENFGLTRDLMLRLRGMDSADAEAEFNRMYPFAKAENEAQRALTSQIAQIESGDRRFLGELDADTALKVAGLDHALGLDTNQKNYDLGMAGYKNVLEQQNLINAGQLADTNARGQWTVADTNARGQWTVANTAEQNKGLLGVADIEADTARYRADREKELEELRSIYSMFSAANQVGLS